mgnify:CR=1 FL=1
MLTESDIKLLKTYSTMIRSKNESVKDRGFGLLDKFILKKTNYCNDGVDLLNELFNQI